MIHKFLYDEQKYIVRNS